MESFYIIYKCYYVDNKREPYRKTRQSHTARYYCDRLNKERNAEEKKLFYYCAWRVAEDLPNIEELIKDNLPFEYGNPDGTKSGTCSGEELNDYWKSIGNHFNQVYPTRNGIDLYTVNTKNGKNPVYFHTKKEVRLWISQYITDSETAKNLLCQLKRLTKKGGCITEIPKGQK